MLQAIPTLHRLVLIVAMATVETQIFAANPNLSTDSQLMTVTQLVELALNRNLGIKAQQASTEAAQYRIAPAGALDDPTLSYYTAPGTLVGNRFSEQLEFSQPLPWPGKLTLRKQAAQEEAQTVVEDEKILRLQVATAAKTLFAEWFYVYQALAINQEHQALLEELRRNAEVQHAAGRVGQQDALQAEIAHTQLEVEAATLDHRRHEVQARINTLLNHPPQAQIPLPADLPEPIELPSLTELQAISLREHPTLARIRAQIAKAIAQEKLAKKDFYPDFRVTTGYNSFWDNFSQRLALGFSINLPLNYGDKRSAALDAAHADLRREHWQLTDQETQLLSKLAISRSAVEEIEIVIGAYTHRLIPLAQNSLNAAQADYRAGAGLFITIINAERQQLRTTEGLVRARADYSRQLAELEQGMGIPLNRPIAPSTPYSQPTKEIIP
ncbi:outer membrane efflux protein [Candidatus Nitrosoglobus terrae]|uniref:Outer membrane efflux protein n=1 Tax=Candidatus Nitrosoglobus terrae TaxID=1630141 RepID=A0A1Q2SNA2_9GAMM|nr:TolC family protein [Candidatus Nitrosoglobus terrae]BAW80616.1 outer membrane efflux protein [Candidatus Nitrosoglobus terrae]